jgi:zinc protease
VEEVQEAARRVLQPAGLTAVVVGDAGRVADPLRAFGPVEVVTPADAADPA